MKFLSPLDNDDILSVMDVLNMSMLFYNEVKMSNIQENPRVIDDLAQSMIFLARQNATVRNLKDLATMEINPEDLVKKVERNGRVLGVILGGKE